MPHILPLQATYTPTTGHIYPHYRPHILPLQATYTPTTGHIYSHYRPLQLGQNKNMCVYGHSTDPMNFYTEFG